MPNILNKMISFLECNKSNEIDRGNLDRINAMTKEEKKENAVKRIKEVKEEIHKMRVQFYERRGKGKDIDLGIN